MNHIQFKYDCGMWNCTGTTVPPQFSFLFFAAAGRAARMAAAAATVVRHFRPFDKKSGGVGIFKMYYAAHYESPLSNNRQLMQHVQSARLQLGNYFLKSQSPQTPIT